MKKLALLTLMSILAFLSFNASAQSLEELAQMVSDAARSEAKINQEREARFLRERNNQQRLLAEARQELANENARSDRLRAEYDQNERALAELETTLAERMGNLGELCPDRFRLLLLRHQLLPQRLLLFSIEGLDAGRLSLEQIQCFLFPALALVHAY